MFRLLEKEGQVGACIRSSEAAVRRYSLEWFAIFTGKQLCWSLFFNKAAQAFRPATLSKRGSNSVVFFWILRNLEEQLFYRTPPMAASDSLSNSL